MVRRNLRIVKQTTPFMGVCERCSSRFESYSAEWEKAGAEITTSFDAHECVPLDSSQNALRAVREAT
jgi:hypothetical protein